MEVTINGYVQELTLIFGEETRFVVRELKYCTVRKCYLLDGVLYPSNIEILPEDWEYFINHLIELSWEWIDMDDNKLATIIVLDV